MSETTHAPGPWEFRVYTDGCTIVSQHDEPGTSVRARLKGVDVKVAARISDNQENARDASPDAQLIRAAPDLLEALEALLRTGLNGGKNVRLALIAASGRALCAEDLARAEDSERAVETAQAAIAKARGENQ